MLLMEIERDTKHDGGVDIETNQRVEIGHSIGDVEPILVTILKGDRLGQIESEYDDEEFKNGIKGATVIQVLYERGSTVIKLDGTKGSWLFASPEVDGERIADKIMELLETQ